MATFRLNSGVHSEGVDDEGVPIWYKAKDEFESKSNLLLKNTPGMPPRYELVSGDVSEYDPASALTNKVSSADSNGTLDEEILFEIETYLAAHFYALRDPQYMEKKTGDASAVFQGRTGMKLDSTLWGQTAITLDLTGFLASVNRGIHKASITWLGKPPSEQIAYKNRD